MSTRVRQGPIAVCSPRRIEWDRLRSICMAIEVSKKKKVDTSPGRCPPESDRVPLESTRQGESNGTGFEASAWL